MNIEKIVKKLFTAEDAEGAEQILNILKSRLRIL